MRRKTATLAAIGLPSDRKARPLTVRKEDSVAISVRLPTDMHIKLKTMTVARQTSIQDVAVEAISRWMEAEDQ